MIVILFVLSNFLIFSLALGYDGGYQSSLATVIDDRERSERMMTTTDALSDIDKFYTANIVGEPANENEFPWFGRLKFTLIDENDNVQRTFNCSASVVYSDIVVTSASCSRDNIERDDPNQAWFGYFYLGANEDRDGTRITIIKSFKPTGNDYPKLDIALFVLQNSTNVTPLTWNTNRRFPTAGDMVQAIGYGYASSDDNDGSKPPQIIKINLQSISNSECEDRSNFDIPRSITCTNPPDTTGDDETNICNGNVGGPLLSDDGVLLGVASFVGETCTEQPAGFARTSSLNVFKDKVICDHSNNPPKGCKGTCGLFGASNFCPFTFGGAFVRFLKRIFG